MRLHLTADQRYRFFVDGVLEGEGPERGDRFNWFYQSYDLTFPPGKHTLVVLVWTLDNLEGIIPGAQISVLHGMLMAADGPYTGLFSTGLSTWECKVVTGVEFRSSGLQGAGVLSGSTVEVDGERYPWGIESGAGEGWAPVAVGSPGRSRIGDDNWGVLDSPLLKPGTLAPPHESVFAGGRVRYLGSIPESELLRVDEALRLETVEQRAQTCLAAEDVLRIEANVRQWILIDLDDYYCGFPELRIEGGRGARVDVLWAEALCESPELPFAKGNRDEVEGKLFVGRGDTFRCAGGPEVSEFTSFWWSCGRYIAILVRTDEVPLTIHSFRIRESRYPLEATAQIRLSNTDFERSKSIMWRAVQMCAHETYMDCPYYEQMNYAADTRVQALVTFLVSGDNRLAKQCIELFAGSLLPTGLTSARYPAEAAQVIPQFSLYWVSMLYDYGRWFSEERWLQPFFPKVRFILDTFIEHINEEGFLDWPDGWNWVDWAWDESDGARDFTAVNQLLLINVLGYASLLEEWIGRRDLVTYYESVRIRLWESVVSRYWCEERGLFSASVEHDVFGEHEQCFAILSGLLDESKQERLKESLVSTAGLQRASIYFRHYLFSAYAKLGLFEHIVAGFRQWSEMVEMGLRTTTEREGETRSDCHAWSAHPLYHAIVSIAGMRPFALGDATLRIEPAVWALASLSVSFPYRGGFVEIEWKQELEGVHLRVRLPEAIAGCLVLEEKEIWISEGGTFDERIELGSLRPF